MANTTETDTYQQACREAATEQGLDPITERLTTERIPHTIDQTGGLCMVVSVPLPGGDRFIITSAAEFGEGDPGDWMLGFENAAGVPGDDYVIGDADTGIDTLISAGADPSPARP